MVSSYNLNNFPFPEKFYVWITIQFSQNALNDNQYSGENGWIKLVGDTTLNCSGEYDEATGVYQYQYIEGWDTDDDDVVELEEDDLVEEFSFEYATNTIPQKLDFLKNNPRVDEFRLTYETFCCNNIIELYKYTRPVSSEDANLRIDLVPPILRE